VPDGNIGPHGKYRRRPGRRVAINSKEVNGRKGGGSFAALISFVSKGGIKIVMRFLSAERKRQRGREGTVKTEGTSVGDSKEPRVTLC